MSENAALAAHWEPCHPSAASALLAHVYGLDVEVTALTSERDETFLVKAGDGRRFVLKIANPMERSDVLAFQQGALLHLEAEAPALPLPRVVRTLECRDSYDLDQPGSGRRITRLLTYLDGEQLCRSRPFPAQQRAIGGLAARLGLALASYRPDVPQQDLLWDISRVASLRPLIPSVAPERQPLVEQVLELYERVVEPALSGLPRQVIHNDINPYNVLVDPEDRARIVGVIDFGDMVEAPRVNELAIAISYQLAGDDPGEALQAVVAGYAAVRRLDPLEAEVLPALVAARLATTITITEWRALSRPENRAYILRNHPSALRGLTFLKACPPADLAQMIGAANGDP